MKKLSLILALILCLIVNPAAAADSCLFVADSSSPVTEASAYADSHQKDGSSAKGNCAHCWCQHHVAMRHKTQPVTFNFTPLSLAFAASDSLAPQSGVQPPLKPPMFA